MFYMQYSYGQTHSIWEETSEAWDDTHPCWKAVGTSPRRVSRSSIVESVFPMEAPYCKSIEGIFSLKGPGRVYYRIVFPSGRTAVVVALAPYLPGTHVIVEADRGEDCAVIEERLCSSADSTEPKEILRAASPRDLEVSALRREQERRALEKCRQLVSEYGCPMQITRCEFQWDMRKITFYFKSTRRVDFRDLVKELFKYFKIRIWMSMENRTNDA